MGGMGVIEDEKLLLKIQFTHLWKTDRGPYQVVILRNCELNAGRLHIADG